MSDGGGATSYRWSGPHGAVRFTPQHPGSQIVIRWSGSRPPGVPAARVTLHAGGTVQVVDLPAGDTWQETTLAGAPGSSVAFSFDVEPFVPGGADPRALGVRLDWVVVR